MFKFLTPIILVGIAVGGFFMFTQPLLGDVNTLRKSISAYNEAMDNSKALDAEKDKLTQKFTSINPNDLEKLEKLLPDSVDNIKLILEIEKLAAPFGMIMKDIKYNVVKKKQEEKQLNADGTEISQEITDSSIKLEDNKDYGSWDLEFSVYGSYFNFLNFVKSLEKNLRIVDISSVEFSSESTEEIGKKTANSTTVTNSNNNYKFTFKIKTYWLKN
jgi:hypothetical protein